LWSRLPKLEGVNKFESLANGGIALVRHPVLKGRGGEGMPVIAINTPQKGRAAVVSTDSMWRWKMEHVGAGGDGRHYDMLLHNLVRWLIKDPALDLIKVTPSSGVRALGESLELDVRIFTPDYKPAGNHGFELTISRRRGILAGESPRVVYQSDDERTDDRGRWTLTQKPIESGVYDVAVNARIAGRRVRAHTVFVVSDERPEMREVRSSTRLMERIAAVTGAKSFLLTERQLQLKFSPPRVNEVTNRRYHERWNLPAVFALGCFLFGFEWWLRRRWGFR
jgi:hypothetical protein